MKTIKNKILKALAVGLCVCCIATPFVLDGNFIDRAKASEAQILPVTQIKETYKKGEDFVLPAANIVYEGKEYPAESRIVFPNGNASTEQEFRLNQLGKYTLVYTAVIDGQRVEKTKEFSVKQDLYEVSSASSTLTFTEEIALSTKRAKQGIHVNLADGDEFRYNEPIDLMGNHGNRYEFFTFYPYSASDIVGDGKSVEVERFIVTLTDCYDETNYVEFEIFYKSNNAGTYYPYYLAGSAKQVNAGLEPTPMTAVSGSRKEVFIDGARYVARFGDDFGVTAAKKNADNLPCTLSYDCLENRIFVEDSQVRLINDLDNAEIYDEKKLFKGFTTGEVYLSVKGENYLGRSMRFDVERLDDKNGAALENKLIDDTKAPVIEVDFNGADENNILLAKGEEISVFNATAYDVNAVGDLQTVVYYNYGSEMQTQVALKNGKFTPSAVGAYTVAYIAKDQSGNVSKKTVTLNCVETNNAPAIALSVEKMATLSAGVDITLPNHSITSINGETKLQMYALFDGNRTDIDGNTRTFLPLNVGEYEIVYEYGDSLRNYVWSYTVESKASDVVRFLDSPNLPAYFIKNASYSLAECYAYTFQEEIPTKNVPQLFVSEDGGEYKACAGEAFKVAAESYVRFKYACQGVEYVTDSIPVVDARFGDNLAMKEYFVGNFEKNADMTGVTYLSKTKTGNNSLEFILPISLSTFLLQFEVPQNASNYQAVRIDLVDYEHKTNVITIRYGNDGLKTKWTIGAGKELTLPKNFAGLHKIFYVNDSQSFSDDSGTSYACPVSFTSDRLLLRVTLEGIYSDAAVKVKSINNQPFNAMEEDFIKPSIKVNSPAGQYQLNDEVTIGAMLPLDVLSPILNGDITVSVVAPDGNVVVAKDNTTLDKASALKEYTIVLKQYGKYVVRYSTKDQSGNKYDLPCNVIVSDSEKPVITLENGYSETTVISAKLNSKITVANYAVSDNISVVEAIKVAVYVINPNGGLFVLGEEKTFTADLVGKWQVCYYVYDEVGNVELRYYTVLVK